MHLSLASKSRSFKPGWTLPSPSSPPNGTPSAPDLKLFSNKSWWRCSSWEVLRLRCWARTSSSTAASSNAASNNARWLIYTFTCRRTANYGIALGEKTSVYMGTGGSRRSVCVPNENLNERLRSGRLHLSSPVIFVMMFSANCEIKIQIVVIQY